MECDRRRRRRTSQVGTLNAVAWTYFFSETLAVHTQWVSEDAYFARGVLLGGWSLLLTILFSLALSALTRAKVRLVTECKAGGMTDAEVEHEAEGVNESAEVLLLLGSKKRHDSTSISHRTRPRPIQDHVHAREEKKKAQGSYVGRAAKGIQGIATFQKSSWKPFYLAVIGLVDSSSGWLVGCVWYAPHASRPHAPSAAAAPPPLTPSPRPLLGRTRSSTWWGRGATRRSRAP